MCGENFRRWRHGLGTLAVLLGTIMGCGGSVEEPPATMSEALPRLDQRVTAPESVGEEPLVPPPAATAPEGPHEVPDPALSMPHVLAGKELGMVVTGKGAGEASRSLDILEQQVLSFLPELQDVYERERLHDTSLMGSLDVSLTIEPGGAVSDLRFPRKRVSGERLTASVFDRMRAWTFPPAEHRVQFRYRLLFVPPGIDQASILLWEKQLGSRDVAAEERKTPAPVATAATPVRKPPPVVSSRPKPVEPTPVPVSGWYRVTSPTLLHAAPRSSSEVVAQLRAGMRVRVVNIVDGTWLEVRSVSNRPPGFLRREDAKPESNERAGRS